MISSVILLYNSVHFLNYREKNNAMVACLFGLRRDVAVAMSGKFKQLFRAFPDRMTRDH